VSDGHILWPIVNVMADTFLDGPRGQEPRRPAVTSGTSYQEFMQLALQQRTARFAALSPENRALIVRTHAEQWLERNRGRLSTGQVDLVHRAIGFLTPTLYRTPDDPELVKKSKALESELRCRLRRSDVIEAFGPSRSPIPRESWLDDMWAWFESCVVG
jgi:hypothetical protein